MANIAPRPLFGCFDVLAVHPVRREMVLIQTTTVGHLAHRLAKVKAAAELPGLLAAGCKVQVHGWKRAGERPGTCGSVCRRRGTGTVLIPRSHRRFE
jgi:hypothetical protein